MMRICTSLHRAGYRVTLIGRQFKNSPGLKARAYDQKRLPVFFKKGPLFYIEYNFRLFFYLLTRKFDCICAIDLDTILPAYLVTFIRKKHRVYDAHEYFSELKEVVSRPGIYKVWKTIEKFAVPKFANGYTVSTSISKDFNKYYAVDYPVIRNMPWRIKSPAVVNVNPKKIIYQGAVNEGRGFEFLIPAMKEVDATLHIYGDGNFLEMAQRITTDMDLNHKIIFEGKVSPEDLASITASGYFGINLVENLGLNQYYSLANKFFDYIQVQLPQVTMRFPEYEKINEAFCVAVLIDDLKPGSISMGINKLLHNNVLYNELKANCVEAAKVLHWEQEEFKLLAFYKNIFG